LGEVSELVSHSHDLAETLENIVHHIRSRFGTDVCSVYTVEKDSGDLVLSATVGLRPESIGCVRMSLHEGLTGLVAEQKSPVAVEDAPKHPRFRYFPESGEEKYHSFLGVPMIQGGAVQGVLVVQHAEPRRFSANEVHMLMGVAAQLAILVTNARLTRELSASIQSQQVRAPSEPPPLRSQLNGVPASPGFAHGWAVRFEPFDFADPSLVARPARSVAEEQQLLAHALEHGGADIDRAARHLAGLLGDAFGALMQAQRLMLEDSGVQAALRRLIDQGASVEKAIVTICNQYLEAFQKLDNPYFYERIYDIKDVFRRVLLRATQASIGATSTRSVVVVADEVSLLELFTTDLECVRGIVIEKGGALSHVAILARSLGIPMLTHVPGLLVNVREGDELFVDAGSGTVYINPDGQRRQFCLKLLEQHEAPEPCEPITATLPIRLETTVNLLPEVARTVECGADAVGLYRSEFLELARRSFPTEEEQLDVYRTMLRMLHGRPLTLRTLDLRAEKLFGIISPHELQETSWEWRLVDQLPHVQDLVRTQLRAALRAALDGPLRILFPMIVTQRQLDRALLLLDEARRSLEHEGLEFQRQVPVGIMIEAPAAALMIRRWARRVDFLCIGSNDLLHSLLGIERNDDRLLQLKSPLDPGYLRLIHHVTKHAHSVGRQVTVCGESSSNPAAALALCALGVDALSAAPSDLPKLRRFFADIVMPNDRTAIRRQLVDASSADEVEQILATRFPRSSRRSSA
jgi:phosphotransferase system enzyme I (PtsP)